MPKLLSLRDLALHGALALALTACSDPPAAPTPPPPPPEPPVSIAAPRPVASSIAFDLVHTPGGAVLAWGTPARNGGGVRALALDPLGSPRGTEVDVVRQGAARSGSSDSAPGQIEELSITSSGTRLGLAWVVSSPSPAAQATFSTQETEGFAPPQTLGPTVSLVPGSRAARGRIALSTRDDGALVVSHRIEDGPCSEAIAAEAGAGRLECARFARAQLDAISAPVEAEPPMEIPAPCPSLLTGSVTAAGTWFYGICHLVPGPVTTVYAIRPAISYAAANDALPGCMPDGLVPLADGAALTAVCESGRSAAILDGTGRVTTTIGALSSDVACEGGRPVIVVPAAPAPLRVPLLASVSRIEGLLPERVAPRGSRATWTGSALLVAAPLESEVSLRRYECREQGLVRTDLP